MTVEFSVDELVPHSGLMSLLDKIVDYGEDWLHAEVHVSSTSMFADEKGVPSWLGLEYLAQTIGAFAGLQERVHGNKPKLGFLVGTRKYECSKDYFLHGQVLSLKVQREMETEAGLNVFQCVLEGQDIHASARLNVFQPDDANKFLKESMS